MAENVPQSVEVPVGLSVFGSLVTEMAPSDLPEGLSPDNQDVVYLPGSVASRPCMRRTYQGLPFNATVTYTRTYVQPTGEPINLVLDSLGSLWKEDIFNNPGILTKIGQVAPGSYCTSTTAFGREYMAFHDGTNGTDVPRQFDGINFDRVSQGGPGAPPTITNLSFAPAVVQNAGPGGAIALTSVVTSDFKEVIIHSGRFVDGGLTTVDIWNTLTFTSAAAHGLVVGDVVTIAGSSDANANGVFVVTVVPSATTFKVAWEDVTEVNGLGGTATKNQSCITRNNNVVTVTTATAHGFPVGFQVVISGIPGANIIGITALARVLGVTEVTTAAAHGLQVGEAININGAADATFDGQTVVFSVLDATHFTYLQPSAADLTVGAAGNIQDVWNGVYVIQSTPTAETFTYLQVGINGQSNTTGAATILGRVAQGNRSCVVMFLTRSGYVTAPSPSVAVACNGGQSLYVQDLPIGPNNVIARIVAFTAAEGGNYFYIPVPASFSGMAVSTSTVVSDNTSTSAVFDFSDNTLLDGRAIDILGNNLFELQVLGLCKGVRYYASRLGWWGQKNKLTNLINMGFDGGYLSGVLTTPLGWTVETAGGILDNGDFSSGWQITGDGSVNPIGRIYQTGYQDINSVPILQPLTVYEANLFGVLNVTSGPVSGNLLMDFYSPTNGVIATASFNTAAFSASGKFFQVKFDNPLPAVVPSDVLIRIYALSMPAAQVITIDEMEIYPAEDPDTRVFLFSYIDKPEAFDGRTGTLGSSDDDSPIQSTFINHGMLDFLTSRGLHESKDSGSLEPNGWQVNQVADKCGCASPRACDSAENFSLWVDASASYPPGGRGVYLYTGGVVYKISQEIQTYFDQMNLSASASIWLKNDPVNRRVYIGIPTDQATASNLILVLDYRELDTASQIAERPPLHISYTGKMVCSDLSRKWTRWNVTANCGEMIQISSTGSTFAVGGGNGLAPGDSGTASEANVYSFDPSLYTDDDYGVVVPYYTTFFFVNHEEEVSLQVGLHRKLFKRYSSYITGGGQLSIVPYANELTNPWPSPVAWPLSSMRTTDLGGGLNITAERAAFRIGSVPNLGETDNWFNIGKFIVTLSQEPVAPIRYGTI